MKILRKEDIREIAASAIIYERGRLLYDNGAFSLLEKSDPGHHVYEVDGHYGNYRTEVELGDPLQTSCDCPFSGGGCKHVVAILMDLLHTASVEAGDLEKNYDSIPLSPQEIRQQALEDRISRGRKEMFRVEEGDMIKGNHHLVTGKGKRYRVTLHELAPFAGHCSCPDYHSNRLGLCKHLVCLEEYLKHKKGSLEQAAAEQFPFVDIYWDSLAGRPRLFCRQQGPKTGPELQALLSTLFDEQQLLKISLLDFVSYINRLEQYPLVQIQEAVIDKLSSVTHDEELKAAALDFRLDISSSLRLKPYNYQKEGILFGLYKKSVLIGDEMGLGKTLQAIGLGVLKKQVFGFSSVLVVTPSSLKKQWKREIERATAENGCIIEGSADMRKQQYDTDTSLFKITNYEAVLRDVTIISAHKPDLIILDEAQRIKNFETKTAEAVKSLPRQHAIILTGTPLENKLEDVYSLVQFLDPDLLSPLWHFAADHFLLSRRKKGNIIGYRNLHLLQEKLAPLLIRRRKEEVLEELPEVVENTYFVGLRKEQEEIHTGFSQLLGPLLSKKFLTPMDVRRIQGLLLKMRQVCDSTYLIDRETNFSPKLDELGTILDELIKENGRKVVIFSEWITMTMLIGKQLSRMSIPFVELSGKIAVPKRQKLVDEFNSNPQCKVFLSTDAGGTGLNLQAADCVINFELPWNPAKVAQRIGRVNRIGQTSKCINVVNLVAKFSIEERIMAGIKLKSELFDGVFEQGRDEVMLSRKSRHEFVEEIRKMMGEEFNGASMETMESEELAEDTPHFLNPEVLAEAVDYTAEENSDEVEPEQPEASGTDGLESSEKMEAVLNQGMGFISGLLEMATGQKLASGAESGKMVTIDKETGEVTLKFTLPKYS